MKQKRYTVDQIIRKLREADVDLGKNKKVVLKQISQVYTLLIKVMDGSLVRITMVKN